MRTLVAGELLEAWERGLPRRSEERGLALLAAALPDQAPDDLALLSIGTRDTRLLELRERTFGPRLTSVAACPHCAERLELDFAIDDIRAAPVPHVESTLVTCIGAYEVRYRLPNSLDLAALSTFTDAETAGRTLLERCVESATHGGEPQGAAALPDEVTLAVAAGMAAADPQADVQLALDCPACGGRWNESFDVLAFFWAEIDAWALRTLREIHTLARWYGWSESAILAMSAWRRQVYLELIGGG